MHDVIVIGGGQAALAAGFYLRRTGLEFTLVDDQAQPGGAWRHGWPSLRLFSPARHSSLPGWLMPDAANGIYPTRDETIAYLTEYERRYALPIRRNVRVLAVHTDGTPAANDAPDWSPLRLVTSQGEMHARHVISATGTWSNPVWPELPGREGFAGQCIHSATYPGAEWYRGKRVLVIGGGNSGAQIFADLLDVAEVQWCLRDEPTFLPDDVDGQYLFEQGTARYKALQEGRTPAPPRSLGDVVMVSPVRAARDAGRLTWRRLPQRLTRHGVLWPDGREEPVDAIIAATGFRPALRHLAPALTTDHSGRIPLLDGRTGHPGIHLLGYGDWTGFASATLIGVGRNAKAVVERIEDVAALR